MKHILDNDVIERLISQFSSSGAGAGTESGDVEPPAIRSARDLAQLIDHTALKADTTEQQVIDLCEEAHQFGFASVCINPAYVATAARSLHDSDVAVCTVIGFPLGASTSEIKAHETAKAISDGATEVDMVLNIGYLKSGRFEEVERDIRAVVEAARHAAPSNSRPGRVLVKVILETALLTAEEKVIGCVLSENAGADFVKTSTGFSTGGATAGDVALMRRVVGDRLGVKASGGVRSAEDAENMIRSGATRIGASASVAIVQGLKGTGEY